MDDSLNTGGENKLPLFIGIGAIAIALLALLFAFKARGDAKALTEKLANFDPASVATKAELSALSNSSAKASDIQEVAGNLKAFQDTVTVNFDRLALGVNEQNKVIAGLTHKGSSTAPAAAKPGAAAPTVGAGEYAVKKGDTFRKIATASGVSLSELIKANPGVDASKIKIGQIIKVPAKK